MTVLNTLQGASFQFRLFNIPVLFEFDLFIFPGSLKGGMRARVSRPFLFFGFSNNDNWDWPPLLFSVHATSSPMLSFSPLF